MGGGRARRPPQADQNAIGSRLFQSWQMSICGSTKVASADDTDSGDRPTRIRYCRLGPGGVGGCRCVERRMCMGDGDAGCTFSIATDQVVGTCN